MDLQQVEQQMDCQVFAKDGLRRRCAPRNDGLGSGDID